MIRRTVLALALVLGVAASPVATPVAANAPDHGAAGIGDPYFPLDGNGGIDVLRYDVHDRYSFARARLSGWTRVTLKATEKLSGFNLDFLLPVTSVKIGGKAVRYDQEQFHELAIHRRVDAGERLELVVRYAGKPGRYTYAGEENWLADDEEVVAMNQPHMAPWWFPANDHPLDRAKIAISITVPKDKTVIANGELAGRTVDGGLATTTWRPEEPMVPYLAFFAAGDFKVAQGTTESGLPWLAAVSEGLAPAQRATAMRLMKRTPELQAWLETVLGDYPFSTTGGLTTSLPVSFALENQTRPTYPFMGDGLGAVQTVVHELAHQWFGDHVAVEGWKDIWLNEGPATFFEAYYNEVENGVSADNWLRNGYSRPANADFWQHEPANPCPDNEQCINSIFASFVYERGGMTLQALRNVVGDEDFFELLRRWVTEQGGTTGRTAQFEALAEEVTGLDLDDFFDVWLHTPAKPADTAANGLG